MAGVDDSGCVRTKFNAALKIQRFPLVYNETPRGAAVTAVDASGDDFRRRLVRRLVRRLKSCLAQLIFGRRVTLRLSVTQCSTANYRARL